MKSTKQGAGIAVVAGVMALTGVWAAAQLASSSLSSKPQAVPLENLPSNGAYYWLSKSNFPPLPANPLTLLPVKLPEGLPAYVISPGAYLVDDRALDWNAINLAMAAVQLDADLKAVESGEKTLKSLLEGESGGGGGMMVVMVTNCGTGEPWTLVNPVATIQSNGLYTFECDIMGGFAGTNLHLFRVDSLSEGGITNFSNAFWQGAYAACAHVLLSNQPALGASFYFGVDQFTDADGDGLPDAWELKHFGSIFAYGPGDDPDLDGVSNGNEFAAGSDPNSIVFTAHFPTAYVNSNGIPFTIQLLSGVPSSMTVLIDSTNLTAAQWVDYSSNALAYLGTTDGRKDVRIGLRGRNADSQQSWELNWVTRDTVAPVVMLTNPVASSGSRPIIQVQGYANEALSLITFNVTNATGILTNQQGFVTGQEFNTNTFSFTTNYFQCFDVPLGMGTNTISIRLTDLAGNVATTNPAYALSFAGDTNAPVLAVAWPPNGAAIGGDQFNLRGTLDDDTAQISAAIVGSSGVTKIVTGLVGRAGQYWIDALPLEAGNNNLIVTTTDAAGNVSTANLTLSRSPASLTINPVSASDVNQPGVTVSGTVSGPTNYSVTVNGVLATDLGGGFWTATGVPSWGGGVASFNASACPAGGGSCVLQSLEVERPPYYAIVDYQQSRNTAFTNSDGTGFSLTVLKQWSGKVVEASSNSWQLLHQGDTRYHNYSYTFATHTDTHYWWSNTNEGGSFVRVVESIPPDGQTTTNTGQGGLASPGGNVIPSAYLDWLDENVTIIHSLFDVDYEWDYPGGEKLTHTHFAKSRMELRTGGKPRSNRSSLFLLHVEGTDYGRPAGIANGLIWAGTPNEDIPGDKLRVLGKPVGADGNLYLTLPDNAVLDGTATATTGSKSYYVGATVAKVKVDIDGDGNVDAYITDDDADELAEDKTPGILVPVYKDGTDASTIILRRLEYAPSPMGNYQLRLRLVGSGVRIYDLSGTNPIIGPNAGTYTIPATGTNLNYEMLLNQSATLTVLGTNAGSMPQLYLELLDGAGVVLNPDEKLQFTVVEVTFDKDANQKYGYDKYATNQYGPSWDFISVKTADSTTFKATVNPASAAPYVWYVPVDSILAVTPPRPGTANPTLTNTCVNYGGSGVAVDIYARLGTTNGPRVGKLETKTYSEKLVDFYFYRVQDSNSPITSLNGTSNPSGDEIRTSVNAIWRQAVLRVANVFGNMTTNLYYDKNTNGILDVYYSISNNNPELNTLTNLAPGETKVIYVREVWGNWRLATNAMAGQSYVDLDFDSSSLESLCPGSTNYLGRVTGNWEEVVITSVTNNRVYFTSALSTNYLAVADTLRQSLAGVSQIGTGLCVISADETAASLPRVIAHELLHQLSIGGLLDLGDAAQDNVMYHTVLDDPNPLLRARGVEPAYGSGPCGSGGLLPPDKQWDQIHQ